MSDERQAEMPFFESAEDATYSAILQSHIPPKDVAMTLWPSMKPDSAYARLMGALKHSRPEKLTADEHVLIANYCGQFDFLRYVELQCHHAGTKQVTPDDERSDLQRNFIKSVQELSILSSRLKALNGGGA